MATKKKTISAKEAIKFYNVSLNTLKKLGMDNYVKNGEKFKTLNEVLTSDTGMVNVQCQKDCTVSDLHMKAGTAYTMSFSIFVQGFKAKDTKTQEKLSLFKPYRHKFSEMFNRYRGQDLHNKRLLVSRYGGLGDLIVIQSTLKVIKEKYPSCHITFATNPNSFGLFKCFPTNLIDEIVPIPFETKYLAKSDYQLLFINAIENCIETQKDNYYDIFKRVVNLDYDVQTYMPTLNPLLEIKLQNKDLVFPKNMIALHMESTTPLRSYPIELWKVVIDTLHKRGYTVGIIDSMKKVDKINNLIIELGVDTTKTLNLASISPSIEHGITIFDEAIGAITIDSTFAHIAGALKKPAVAICGPYPAYNVVGHYETVIGADKPGVEKVCVKEPCYLNSQTHLCPYVQTGMQPVCTSTINPIRIVDLLEEQLKKFAK